MDVNTQLLPSSSQSPEVAVMEKQVQDLTANLEELTRKTKSLIKISYRLKGRIKRTKGKTRSEVMSSHDKNKRQKRGLSTRG